MRHNRITVALLASVLGCVSLVFEARGWQDRSPPVVTQPADVSFTKKTYTYKTVKDCKIKADVYRAAGDEIRPVILWIHGGALVLGDRGMLTEDQLQHYLHGGYVVVSIDYRLAPETKLAAIIEDLQDAYQWLRVKGPELFRIDPNRIAVIGGSAGGYLTLMSGFCVTPRPKALVSFYGFGDIGSEWQTRPKKPDIQKQELISKERAYEGIGKHEISESPVFPRVTFFNYCKQNGLWLQEVIGHEPTTEAKELERFSPIRNVTPEYPATLFLHGDKDTEVPFEQSVQMAAALKEHHVPHRLIRMENRDHLFDVFDSYPPQGNPVGLKDPKVAEAFDAVLAFLDEHVGPPARRAEATTPSNKEIVRRHYDEVFVKWNLAGADPSLAAEIARIKAIDNHAHPVRATGEEDDREFDALIPDTLESAPLPLRLRPDNPEFVGAWRVLYGYAPSKP